MGLINSIKVAYNRHGSTTLTVIAAVGSVAGAVLAYNAGKRVGQNPKMTTKEKVLNVVPPVVAETVAITAGITAHATDAGKIAALATATLMDEKKRKKFMENAEKYIGKENLDKIKASMHPVDDIDNIPQRTDGKILFVDDVTGARSWNTKEEMYKAIDNWHAYYHSNQFVSWGKMLEYGGFERFDGKTRPLPFTEDAYGTKTIDMSDDDIGFRTDIQWEEGYGTDWIDVRLLDRTTDKGTPYVLLDPEWYPYAGFMEIEKYRD